LPAIRPIAGTLPQPVDFGVVIKIVTILKSFCSELKDFKIAHISQRPKKAVRCRALPMDEFLPFSNLFFDSLKKSPR
jgi:hypothetical protein